MKRIKSSHEVPLCLLEHSKQYNDYQYCLPHLMDKYEEYKNFFLKCKDEGIYIMMDNSLHELGTPYSKDRLLYWLEELKPQEFFIPDYWQDKNRSLVSAKEWVQYKEQFPDTVFIPVVQGDSKEEALECFSIYKNHLGYKKIAFSYGASWYKDMIDYNTPHSEKNTHVRTMLGRIEFINWLFELGFLDEHDNIHLLGCQLPQEFSFYEKEIRNIISTIDTSNPIMASIEGLEYTKFGLETKPVTRIDDVMEIDLSLINLDLLNQNVLYFKTLNNL